MFSHDYDEAFDLEGFHTSEQVYNYGRWERDVVVVENIRNAIQRIRNNS